VSRASSNRLLLLRAGLLHRAPKLLPSLAHDPPVCLRVVGPQFARLDFVSVRDTAHYEDGLRRQPAPAAPGDAQFPQVGGGYFGILVVAKNILEILERADEILRGVAIDTREELEGVA
jgi:hypothetical protein